MEESTATSIYGDAAPVPPRLTALHGPTRLHSVEAAAAPDGSPMVHPILQHAIIEQIAEHLRKKDRPETTAETVRRAYLHAYSSPTVEAIVARMQQYLPGADADLVRRAYALASIAHEGQYRRSGEPYIDHPVAVATILLELRLDADSVAAALLHDVVEDTRVSLDLIKAQFGLVIAHLVDGVTKLSGLEKQSKEEIQAGTYRKLFIASANDPRVLLIKLADRLHNVRTLGATSAEQQRRVARETLEIYAPLAHRLGMWQFKSELEDLAFKSLRPERYQEIAQQITLRKDARERVILRVIKKLKELLEGEGIRAQVTGRPKHIYSIWRKMERKGLPLDRIYDQLAVRVIIDDKGSDANAKGLCYRVLGVVHTMWTPVLSEFDDYIAVPKESSYQSLHTTVIIPGGHYCEVQIRTEGMHEVAEHGIAAHWRYKEGFGRPASDQSYEAKIGWLRSLISWGGDLSDREFVESLKPELEDQVYIFTPKGKIIDLPVGSTPVDFAYRIHSEVGNRCVGARVNSKIVPLDYHLQNGEIVDIMTTKVGRGPSRDWLNFVKTAGARNHIKRYFRRGEREEHIVAGRDLLEKELKRLGLTISFESLVDLSGLRSQDDLFAQIGSGEITARTLAQKALAQQVEQQAPIDPPMVETPSAPNARSQPVGVQVIGVGAVHNRIARCCNPVIGEPITGYVTRGRGITVHRADCRTILNERDRNRLIDVSWGGQQPKGSPVPVRIESWDRVGLWRDVSAVIADAGVNIEKIEQGTSRRAGRAVLHVVLTIQNVNQLSSLLDKLNRIPDVIEVRRETGGAR